MTPAVLRELVSQRDRLGVVRSGKPKGWWAVAIDPQHTLRWRARSGVSGARGMGRHEKTQLSREDIL